MIISKSDLANLIWFVKELTFLPLTKWAKSSKKAHKSRTVSFEIFDLN